MKQKYYLVGYLDYGSPVFKTFKTKSKLSDFLRNELGILSGEDTVRSFEMEENDYTLIYSKPRDYVQIQKRKELIEGLKKRFVNTVGKLWEKPMNKNIPDTAEDLLSKKRPWFWKPPKHDRISSRQK